MKFYTTTYTDQEDLLSIIKRRMALSGWTIHRHGWMNSGDQRLGSQMHVSKNGLHFGFRVIGRYSVYSETYFGYTSYEQLGILVNAKDGFDSDAIYSNQPGLRTTPMCYLESRFGGTCYIFSDGDYFIISTKYDSGEFSTIAFGGLPVISAGTGGQFVSSTHIYEWLVKRPLFVNSHRSFIIRLNHGEFSGWDAGARTISSFLANDSALNFPSHAPKIVRDNGSNLSGQYGEMGNVPRSKILNYGGPGLIPVNFFTLYGGKYSPFAEFSDLFFVSLDYVEPGKAFSIGENRFVVIPFWKKGSWAESDAVTYNAGIAVKIDE